MADPTPVSPTGKPLVPAKFVPYIAAVASLSGLVAGMGGVGLSFVTPQVTGIAGAVFGLCLLLLGIGPGLRGQAGLEAVQQVSQQAATDAAKAKGEAAAKDPGGTLGG